MAGIGSAPRGRKNYGIRGHAKTRVRREELGCASDNLSSDPNAYPLIPTFSKPHSEVASTTHLPALKRFRKGASLVFWFSSRRKVPQQMQRLKNAAKGGLLRQKIPLPQPAEIYTQRGAAAQSPAPNRTANPLPEVHWISRWKKIPVSPLQLPSHPPFESLHLTAGTFRSAARRENDPQQTGGFRTLYLQGRLPHKYRFTYCNNVRRGLLWRAGFHVSLSLRSRLR